jgi:hypothetical protein
MHGEHDSERREKFSAARADCKARIGLKFQGLLSDGQNKAWSFDIVYRILEVSPTESLIFFIYLFFCPAGRKVGIPHRARVPHGTALTRGFKECLKTDRVTLPGHPLLSNNIGGRNSKIVNDGH